jgi:glycosyltransferase involved in cell wall biosynthesis
MGDEGDGFGLVLLEASLAGVPCIAGEGGTVETVADGETGWIVDPRDVPALGSVLSHALADPGLCASMGRAARTWAQHHFAPHRQLEAFARLVLQTPPHVAMGPPDDLDSDPGHDQTSSGSRP